MFYHDRERAREQAPRGGECGCSYSDAGGCHDCKGYLTGRLLHKRRQRDAKLFAGGLLSFFVPANVTSLVPNFLTVTISKPRHTNDHDADDDKNNQDVKWTKCFHKLRPRRAGPFVGSG